MLTTAAHKIAHPTIWAKQKWLVINLMSDDHFFFAVSAENLQFDD